MSNENLSRRKLLERGAHLGGVLVAAGAAGTAQAAAPAKMCANIATMDSGGKSIREALMYTESFKDPTMTCQLCAFFVPDGSGCGMCMIFTGIANANGHCDSWSNKEG